MSSGNNACFLAGYKVDNLLVPVVLTRSAMQVQTSYARRRNGVFYRGQAS